MSEFHSEIRDRMAAARRSLAEARDDSDDYLVQVRLGELESLERLASDHGAESA
jgi:hypothetical protein